ncbi:MAG: phage holin, LLH family [Oscillospiraceae bacterium]
MNITPIINAAIVLIAALITAFLVPWIKSKVGQQNVEQLLVWVKIAVAAAEQIYTNLDGDVKMQYVLDFLKSKGYKVDTEEIHNAIEAAVLSLHSDLYGATKEA